MSFADAHLIDNLPLVVSNYSDGDISFTIPYLEGFSKHGPSLKAGLQAKIHRKVEEPFRRRYNAGITRLYRLTAIRSDAHLFRGVDPVASILDRETPRFFMITFNAAEYAHMQEIKRRTNNTGFGTRYNNGISNAAARELLRCYWSRSGWKEIPGDGAYAALRVLKVRYSCILDAYRNLWALEDLIGEE